MTRKMDWCRRYVWLEGRPIRYERRPYLPAIYAAARKNLVLRCSRQTEKSTFLMATILSELCCSRGIKILFVSPREEQSSVFCRMRLFPSLEASPFIRKVLLGRSRRPARMGNITFENGSQLYVRSAFRSADSARGISADLLVVDEYQDLAGDSLPVLRETLSHSARRQTILVGTPKMMENGLESAFALSTAHEWTLRCAECAERFLPDEKAIGPESIACPQCLRAVDPCEGEWVARNPESSFATGFWINHLLVPWINHDEILDRQRTYDLAKFKNEVLGLPTALGDHVVTRAELQACCTQTPMWDLPRGIPTQGRSGVIAGIDWGGGGTSATVLVIGYVDAAYNFHVCRFDRFRQDDDPELLVREVAHRCRKFGVTLFAADGGGNGHVLNRLLQAELGQYEYFYAILYSQSWSEPRPEGTLHKWSVDREAALGAVFSRIKKQGIRLPREEDCRSFLDEISCELALFDDHHRRIKYTHPESVNDDALHALNYALLLGQRVYQYQAQAL